ncbi:MAG: hypothetical protein CMI53_00875 [Parcubacteria group bacterium]|jgi:type II secretory pathway pseudopilin PulG|nr:hypothetical protein [Parcubacteria group bacterium]|tara:strand:- start:4540 stop:5106 length:567 start_codon:yes stop_codon:yes gene_type:complete
MNKSNLKSGFTPHLLWGKREKIYSTIKKGGGFTLIEMIIYILIVGIILVSISYLILDLISGQIRGYASSDVNQNIRFISNTLTKDIKSAQAIGSLAADTLVLTMPGDDITYNFDSLDNKITRQLGVATAEDLNSTRVNITGNFTDLSYLTRTKNINIELIVSYKNPSNLPDYNASTTANFSVELRGYR